MSRLAVIIAILILSTLPVFSAPEDGNYCHNKEDALVWEAMAKKNPNDFGLQKLHALRLGICQKIEEGTLSLNDGIDIFEREREAVVRKRAEKEMSKREGLVH